MDKADSRKVADKEEPSRQALLRLHAELTKLTAQVQTSIQDVMILTENLVSEKYDNNVEVEETDIVIGSEAAVDQNCTKNGVKHKQKLPEAKGSVSTTDSSGEYVETIIGEQVPKLSQEVVEKENTEAKMLAGKEAARMIAEIKETASELMPILYMLKKSDYNQPFDMKNVEQQLAQCREQQKVELFEFQSIMTDTYSLLEKLSTEITMDSGCQDSLAFSDFMDKNTDMATSSPLSGTDDLQ